MKGEIERAHLRAIGMRGKVVHQLFSCYLKKYLTCCGRSAATENGQHQEEAKTEALLKPTSVS